MRRPGRRISAFADVGIVGASDHGWRKVGATIARVRRVHRHRLSIPVDPARRVATWSLLMVAASAGAALIAGAVGTFLQLVVFDLEEQELLSEAGGWGYVAGFCVLALMLLPALAGIGFGIRGRRLGARRLGTTGVAVNALIAAYLLVTAARGLLFG